MLRTGRLFIALALATQIPAASANAQSWFTREACTVTVPAVDPAAIDPATLARITAEAAAVENGVGRFWKITAPGGAVSHLWGTSHSNDPLMLDLPDPLRAALARARTVAVEFDPVLKTRAEVEVWYRGGATFLDHALERAYANLDRRVLGWIEARLRSRGYEDGMIDRLTPSGLAELVMADACDDFADGVLPTQDGRIQLLALDAGARIVGLEAPDALARKLNGPGGRAIADPIIETYGALLRPGNIRPERRTAFAFYLEGRIAEYMVWDRLFALEFFGPERGAALWDRMNGYLVDERNGDFLPRILPLLLQGDAVIAVGAFHLPGRNGLVALIRNEGFAVERVPTGGEAPTPR